MGERVGVTGWVGVLGPLVAWRPVARLVQKFGGTSVGDPERIRAVADHVARCRRRGDEIVLVVSAMGKETDELLRIAAEVSATRPGREMDMLITAGERKAIALVSMALADIGVPADSYTGSQAGFITDTNHTDAKILEVRADRIAETLASGRVAVVAGAQGVDSVRSLTFQQVARIPRPSRLPRPSAPMPASCTPTYRGSTRPIPAWCPLRARCRASASTNCWR